MAVSWSNKTREAFTHCVQCSRKGKDCPGWNRPTGGCAQGKKERIK